MSAINGHIAEELRYLRTRGLVNDAKRRLFKTNFPSTSESEMLDSSSSCRGVNQVSIANKNRIRVGPVEFKTLIPSAAAEVEAPIDEPKQDVPESARAAATDGSAKGELMVKKPDLEEKVNSISTTTVKESLQSQVPSVKETGEGSKMKPHIAAPNKEAETTVLLCTVAPPTVRSSTTANRIRKMLTNLGSAFTACLRGRRASSGTRNGDYVEESPVALQQMARGDNLENKMTKSLENVDGDQSTHVRMEHTEPSEASTSSLERDVTENMDLGRKMMAKKRDNNMQETVMLDIETSRKTLTIDKEYTVSQIRQMFERRE